MSMENSPRYQAAPEQSGKTRIITPDIDRLYVRFTLPYLKCILNVQLLIERTLAESDYWKQDELTSHLNYQRGIAFAFPDQSGFRSRTFDIEAMRTGCECPQCLTYCAACTMSGLESAAKIIRARKSHSIPGFLLVDFSACLVGVILIGAHRRAKSWRDSYWSLGDEKFGTTGTTGFHHHTSEEWPTGVPIRD